MSARALCPETFEETASMLASAGTEQKSVRILGAGTKLGWGSPSPEADIELRTSALDSIVEHNVGDLTAVLEAGVPLARAQAQFATEGQMLALDPPLGQNSVRDATIGGMVATADSGPMSHRYGGPRDLVVGMTVALSDGTIARSGGKVIKNVAGYDLGKLFAGSFGTLGVIVRVNVRLHPLPIATASTLATSADPNVLAGAAVAIAGAPLELESLDVAWRGGRGGLLARSAGAEVARRAERVAERMREAGLEQVEVVDDDDELWARQRAGQRSRSGALVRVAIRPSSLARVLGATDSCGGTVVGRAASGTLFVELDPDSVASLRESLPSGARAVVLDMPEELRASVDPWGSSEGPALELMRRVKTRFDPARTCNPGLFVGGI